MSTNANMLILKSVCFNCFKLHQSYCFVKIVHPLLSSKYREIENDSRWLLNWGSTVIVSVRSTFYVSLQSFEGSDSVEFFNAPTTLRIGIPENLTFDLCISYPRSNVRISAAAVDTLVENILVQKIDIVEAGSGFDYCLDYNNLTRYSEDLYSPTNTTLNLGYIVNKGSSPSLPILPLSFSLSVLLIMVCLSIRQFLKSRRDRGWVYYFRLFDRLTA